MKPSETARSNSSSIVRPEMKSCTSSAARSVWRIASGRSSCTSRANSADHSSTSMSASSPASSPSSAIQRIKIVACRKPSPPGTTENVAYPSLHGCTRKMLLLAVSARWAEVPGGSSPVFGGKPVACISVQMIAACCETSRCCPSPDRSRSRSAIAVSAAAWTPAWIEACGKPTGTGGRSPSPCNPTNPPAASIVRSEAGRLAHGPSLPYGVIDT